MNELLESVETHKEIVSLVESEKVLSMAKLNRQFGFAREEERSLLRALKPTLKENRIIFHKNALYSSSAYEEKTLTVFEKGHGNFFAKHESGEEFYLPPKVAKMFLPNDVFLAGVIKREKADKEEFEVVPIKVKNRQQDTICYGQIIKNDQRELKLILLGRAESVEFDLPRAPWLKKRGGTLTQWHWGWPHQRGEQKKNPVGSQEWSAGDLLTIKIKENGFLGPRNRLEVVDYLGHESEPCIESKLVLSMNNWPTQFSKMEKDLAWHSAEHAKRELDQVSIDVDETPFMTIDGKGSRDYDDALYAKRTDSGFELRVAIADVTEVIGDNSPLEQAAQQRATSIYLPHGSISMLPDVMSHDLCSLVPLERRYALVLVVQLDHAGSVQSYSFKKSIITSAARLTYDAVGQWIANQDVNCLYEDPCVLDSRKESEIVSAIGVLDSIAGILSKKNPSRLEIERNEEILRLNENGKIESVDSRKMNTADQLVAECMVLANEIAADFLESKLGFGVFRNQKLLEKEEIKGDLNWWCGMDVSQESLSTILKTYKSHESYAMIKSDVIRSLSSARYEMYNGGHFSLGAKAYTHFTSPIRRYTDMLVHKMVGWVLTGMTKEEVLEKMGGADGLAKKIEHCDLMNKKANMMDQEAEKWLKFEWLKRAVPKGRTVSGEVQGITEMGLTVYLVGLNTTVFVHFRGLEREGFKFDEEKKNWKKNTSGEIGLSSKISLKVAKINKHQKRIEWCLDQASISARGE